MAALTPAVLHLSLVTGGELRDPAGERLGRVDDLIVRLGDEDYPPVTGVVATVAGRPVFLAAEQVVEIAPGVVTLDADQLDLQHFRRRPQEVLLKKDVLDRQLINVDGARLVRANEIELARLDGWYRVVGVDVSLPKALAARHPARVRRPRHARLVPRLGVSRAVHRPRSDGAPARAAPEAREAPSRPARRPRRGGVT